MLVWITADAPQALHARQNLRPSLRMTASLPQVGHVLSMGVFSVQSMQRQKRAPRTLLERLAQDKSATFAESAQRRLEQ
jgi:hypothetical protein